MLTFLTMDMGQNKVLKTNEGMWGIKSTKYILLRDVYCKELLLILQN